MYIFSLADCLRIFLVGVSMDLGLLEYLTNN